MEFIVASYWAVGAIAVIAAVVYCYKTWKKY